MANIKWSAFPSRAAASASGDTLMGLYSGANYQFDISSASTALAIGQRDSSANFGANNVLQGYTTTATAAGTTTLTVASTYFQHFTGSTTQIVVMPVTSTLALGQSWYLVNNSSGDVTVNSSGGNEIQVMAADTSLLIICSLLTGGTAASWNETYIVDSGGTVNTGVINELAYYAASGSVVSSYTIGTGVLNALAENVNGSGAISLTTSPTFITPVLGAATATSLDFTSTAELIGTTTNDNADAGSVGEYVSSIVVLGSAVSLTTGTAADITSISLTAGDWDVWGSGGTTANGATVIGRITFYVSTTSVTLPTFPAASTARAQSGDVAAGATRPLISTGAVRMSLSGTTTVYLGCLADFTVSTMGGYGMIQARRVR